MTHLIWRRESFWFNLDIKVYDRDQLKWIVTWFARSLNFHFLFFFLHINSTTKYAKIKIKFYKPLSDIYIYIYKKTFYRERGLFLNTESRHIRPLLKMVLLLWKVWMDKALSWVDGKRKRRSLLRLLRQIFFSSTPSFDIGHL